MQTSRDSRQARADPQIEAARARRVGRRLAVAIPVFVFSARWRSSPSAVLFAVVGVFAVVQPGPAADERAGQPRVPVRIGRLRPHRHGRAGPLQRRREPRAGHLRPDPADPDRRRHLHRGPDVLDEHRRRPGRHRCRPSLDTLRGRERGASTITQQLVRQRLLDPELVRDPGRGDRAQDQGDHPVGSRDRGLPGRGGQAADHHRLPEPELLRQRRVRHQGRGAQLLRRRRPERADARPGGAARRRCPSRRRRTTSCATPSWPTTARSTCRSTRASRSSRGATSSSSRWPPIRRAWC